MLISGSEIKRLRSNAGFSQQDFAKEISITNVYLSKIENDRVLATLTRIKIMKYFKHMGDICIPSIS